MLSSALYLEEFPESGLISSLLLMSEAPHALVHESPWKSSPTMSAEKVLSSSLMPVVGEDDSQDDMRRLS